jgi:hypothetical protein
MHDLSTFESKVPFVNNNATLYLAVCVTFAS